MLPICSQFAPNLLPNCYLLAILLPDCSQIAPRLLSNCYLFATHTIEIAYPIGTLSKVYFRVPRVSPLNPKSGALRLPHHSSRKKDFPCSSDAHFLQICKRASLVSCHRQFYRQCLWPISLKIPSIQSSISASIAFEGKIDGEYRHIKALFAPQCGLRYAAERRTARALRP